VQTSQCRRCGRRRGSNSLATLHRHRARFAYRFKLLATGGQHSSPDIGARRFEGVARSVEERRVTACGALVQLPPPGSPSQHPAGQADVHSGRAEQGSLCASPALASGGVIGPTIRRRRAWRWRARARLVPLSAARDGSPANNQHPLPGLPLHPRRSRPPRQPQCSRSRR
jgi:hypothetical protein